MTRAENLLLADSLEEGSKVNAFPFQTCLDSKRQTRGGIASIVEIIAGNLAITVDINNFSSTWAQGVKNLFSWRRDDVTFLRTCMVGIPIVHLIVCIYFLLILEQTVCLVNVDGITWLANQAIAVFASVRYVLSIGEFHYFRPSV